MPESFDSDKFLHLIEQGMFDQARLMLEEFFQKEPTELEKGEFYVTVMSEYLKLMNALNRRYLMALRSGIAELEEINSVSRKVDDDLALNDVKKRMEEV